MTTATPSIAPVQAFPGASGHERIEVRQDAATGMRLVVAIHSTALGPGLGGLRLRPYAGGLREALDDAMALARTMTLKAAAAGLHLGGGKAVMIDDGSMPPGSVVRERRLEGAGRVIEELGGAYVTAEDVGTTTVDMEAIARETRFVVGRAADCGGGGDPSPITAETVFRAIVAGLEASGRGRDLAGRRIGVVGLGKVGSVLVERLLGEGADVLGFDVDPARLAWAQARGVEIAAGAEEVVRAPIDVLAPCALGGLIDHDAAATLRCPVVCGAANNPLTGPDVAAELHERGILYVPDFLSNCGGLIHVAAEWDPDLDVTDALAAAEGHVECALSEAAATGTTPLAAGERIAFERIASAGRRAA